MHEIFDLGAAWAELTNLPFVYAVWALRRGIENKDLRRELRDAKKFGMETLDYIIETREEYDEDFRRDYLGWHIHYHLAADEKRGIAKFCELLRKHNLGPVFEPKFVSVDLQRRNGVAKKEIVVYSLCLCVSVAKLLPCFSNFANVSGSRTSTQRPWISRPASFCPLR